MSWQATGWAKLWRLGAPNRKAVLLVTADYANHETGPDGAPVPAGSAVCWASLSAIAEGAEVNERTVRRLFAAFEAVGVIRRERRHDRRGYRLPDAVWLPIGQLPRDDAAALIDAALADRRSPVGQADSRGPVGAVDNAAGDPGSDPVEPPPTGPGGPGLADPAGTGPSGPLWSAQEPSVEPLEEPQPPGLRTEPPTARATVDNDEDARRYAAASAELRRLPDFGLALIEEIRDALPGQPDLTTLVIAAGELTRERRQRKTG